MRIRSIETFPVRIPLKPERRMVSSLGRHTVSDYVVVRMVDDRGIVGVGEATVMPRWSGETVFGACAVIDDVLAPVLSGSDVETVEDLDHRMDLVVQDNWFAKSALEMAYWDILGQAADKPIFELLGGAVRDLDIRCRFSLGAYSPDVARERTQKLIEDGFTTMKVKVGTGYDEDIARVRTVREVIGPDRHLVIDANGGWDAETAIRAANELEAANVGLFEQPTPRHDYQGLARVRQAVSMPVMADDLVFDERHAGECLAGECADVISVYPGKAGGIAKAKRIVEMAAARGVECSIGSNLEWDIATAAMCHLVVACDNVVIEKWPGDILGPAYHEFSIATNPLAVSGPIITTPTGPGLGVTVDWERINEAVIRRDS